ncbi:hypothetical protein PHYPSEUDO_004071 [Phytophthora pseudosyringae]|uniref:GIY-YIG domain-containing protein n=1 Tax=Phytophthora pseudosyringae TaxID=221518 RepID=A0A8T1VSM5_9STRA|nr:hypothetical protein PHYPSEUDO_004071 [Phytophthora pseudosyringae]
MTDTRTGHIYKIVCSKSNDVYVGSTLNALRTRMAQHKRAFASGNGLAIYSAFKQHGWESLHMILIDTYEVVDRKHLMMYETLWFNKLKGINKNTPFQIKKKVTAKVDMASQSTKRERELEREKVRKAKAEAAAKSRAEYLDAVEAEAKLKAATPFIRSKQQEWYAERKRITREYRSPYKLPAGSAKVIELERDPEIIKSLVSYRMPSLQEIIDHDIKILESRK